MLIMRNSFTKTSGQYGCQSYALLVTALFFGGSINAGFCQATFILSNYVPGAGLDAPVFDASGSRLAGANYVAVVYGGATRDSLQPAHVGSSDMPPIPFTYMPNGQSGYFAAGGGIIISDVPENGYAWLQVRAWDLRLGATYDDVVARGAGGYGESPLFYTYGGGLIGGLPHQPLIGLESFSLVPEPATWTLLALGSGLFVCKHRHRFRRRK
jgi:hypothetical protein